MVGVSAGVEGAGVVGVGGAVACTKVDGLEFGSLTTCAGFPVIIGSKFFTPIRAQETILIASSLTTRVYLIKESACTKIMRLKINIKLVFKIDLFNDKIVLPRCLGHHHNGLRRAISQGVNCQN